MVSFLELPLDVVALISIRAETKGWLALSRVCRRFGKLAYANHKRVILAGLTVRKVNLEAIIWTVGKQLHRGDDLHDLPAVSYSDGHTEWWQYGECHRDHAPSVIWSNGDEDWYFRGEFYKNKNL